MNHTPKPQPNAAIDKADLIADLSKIGIAKGDHLAVALAFKKIGFVKGGPDVFIDALKETVGTEGTLLLNAHTNSFNLCAIDPDYVFDQQTTPPMVGLVPTVFWKRKDAIRSRHPTCSVAVWGKMASYLVDGHDEHSTNPYLPYVKLMETGGKFLFIGTENRLVAIRHEAQRQAGLFQSDSLRAVKYKRLDGRVSVFTWVYPPCAQALPALVPKLEKMGLVHRGKIGEARSLLCSGEVLNVMTQMLKQDPTLTLCDDVYCVNCRELEHKLNLYPRIRNPRVFQRSQLIRETLHIRNKVVQQHYNRLRFQRPNQSRLLEPVSVQETVLRRAVWVALKILGSP
jgi:aminoglycoside 3-N-acetyltransferase